MLMRALYALRSILPVPEDEVYRRRDYDDHDHDRQSDDPWERRGDDDRDLLAPLDEKMLAKLAEVDPREATDPAIHVVICGMRYEFVGSALKAIYDAVRAHGRGSRFNSGQLLLVRSEMKQMKNVLWMLLLLMAVLGVIEVLGKDRGIELLTRLAERWLGI